MPRNQLPIIYRLFLPPVKLKSQTTGAPGNMAFRLITDYRQAQCPFKMPRVPQVEHPGNSSVGLQPTSLYWAQVIPFFLSSLFPPIWVLGNRPFFLKRRVTARPAKATASRIVVIISNLRSIPIWFDCTPVELNCVSKIVILPC